jgi:hypothetical protein
VKPSDALAIALRTNDRQAWKLAKRMAHVEIGRFAVALCIGLEAHLKREEERARIREGGFIIELAASSPA